MQDVLLKNLAATPLPARGAPSADSSLAMFRMPVAPPDFDISMRWKRMASSIEMK
jgi:hypothetical protein